ncbi:MAG: hypothetical protein ACQKBT_04690 [Puniceicoccales bacterium]
MPFHRMDTFLRLWILIGLLASPVLHGADDSSSSKTDDKQTEQSEEEKTSPAEPEKDSKSFMSKIVSEAKSLKNHISQSVSKSSKKSDTTKDGEKNPPPGMVEGKVILASTGQEATHYIPIADQMSSKEAKILQEEPLIDSPKPKVENPTPTRSERSVVTRIRNSALIEESYPLADLPERPGLLLSFGDPFFGPGPINKGFEIPTGAVWNPQFFIFGTYSTAVQTFDDGNVQTTEWVNAIDLFANLNLTPTERLLVGFTPLDKDGNFTGYQWDPEEKGLDALNGNIETLFFEGHLTSLFPGLLDSSVDWNVDFSVGRQPLFYQDGILLNDNIDSIGITRTSLFWLGSSATTITGLFGWDNIDRGTGVNTEEQGASLFGLFTQWNYDDLQVQFDVTYVDGGSGNEGDGTNISLGANTRLWGWLNTTSSINQSIADGEETEGNGTGTLLFTQFSTQPSYTVDNLYLSAFLGIDEYTSAARGANSGGPLGQAGILFAATGLGTFGPALNSTGQKTAGGALGYQHFIGDINQQIIGEIGAVTSLQGDSDTAVATGAEYVLGFWQHFILTLGASVTFQEDTQTGYGLRSVVTYSY